MILLSRISTLIPYTTLFRSVDGSDVLTYNGRELRELRTKVGMIFQNYNLVNRSSVLKNVLAGRLGHTGTFRSLLNMYKKVVVVRMYICFESVNLVHINFIRTKVYYSD